jgi:hypothetical protein
MNRYIVPAAIAVLALCAPVASQAQVTGPVDLEVEGGNVAAAPTTYSDEGRFGSGYFGGGGYFGGSNLGPTLAPAPMAAPMASAPPLGRTWIQGHYNWDPARQTYAWIEGQYVQSPHLNAQWTPGHWTQTPTAWIWVDGSWN